MEMTRYEYMYWLARYGMISEKDWNDYCLKELEKIMSDKEIINIFKRLKFT